MTWSGKVKLEILGIDPDVDCKVNGNKTREASFDMIDRIKYMPRIGNAETLKNKTAKVLEITVAIYQIFIPDK